MFYQVPTKPFAMLSYVTKISCFHHWIFDFDSSIKEDDAIAITIIWNIFTNFAISIKIYRKYLQFYFFGNQKILLQKKLNMVICDKLHKIAYRYIIHIEI